MLDDIEMLKKSNRSIAKEIFNLQDRMDTFDDRVTLEGIEGIYET